MLPIFTSSRSITLTCYFRGPRWHGCYFPWIHLVLILLGRTLTSWPVPPPWSNTASEDLPFHLPPRFFILCPSLKSWFSPGFCPGPFHCDQDWKCAPIVSGYCFQLHMFLPATMQSVHFMLACKSCSHQTIDSHYLNWNHLLSPLSDSGRRVPAEYGEESHASSSVEEWISITGCWIYFPVLYIRTLLLIHSKCNSLHLPNPNSQSISLLPSLPLGNHKSDFYVCESVSV